jgi:hypothetical protein
MKLFKPAWDSIYRGRAVRAVKKITDEATLIRIAREARCLQARLAAIKKLINWDIQLDSILFDIAQNGTDSKFLIGSVARVTDPILLARMAKEAWCLEAALTAVEKISDPTLLADIAKNGRYSAVREAASTPKTHNPLYLQLPL